MTSLILWRSVVGYHSGNRCISMDLEVKRNFVAYPRTSLGGLRDEKTKTSPPSKKGETLSIRSACESFNFQIEFCRGKLFSSVSGWRNSINRSARSDLVDVHRKSIPARDPETMSGIVSSARFLLPFPQLSLMNSYLSR